jgi:alkylation response protein AidB-like acyl-CoA dehydrogenase
MAGSGAQKSFARDLIFGGGAFCLAVSERSHGADLLAIETLAIAHGGQIYLHGEKWPIGRASTSEAVLVRLLAMRGEAVLARFLGTWWISAPQTPKRSISYQECGRSDSAPPN